MFSSALVFLLLIIFCYCVALFHVSFLWHHLPAICCFFMLLFIAEIICSHSFSCRISQCMFTLIFCVGTWLFWPVNYYCRMLFDSKTVPRNKKKKCCSQTFWTLLQVAVTHSSVLQCVSRRRHCKEMEIDSINAEDYSLKPQFFIHSLSLQWFPFIPKSGIISIQMKSGGE